MLSVWVEWSLWSVILPPPLTAMLTLVQKTSCCQESRTTSLDLGMYILSCCICTYKHTCIIIMCVCTLCRCTYVCTYMHACMYVLVAWPASCRMAHECMRVCIGNGYVQAHMYNMSYNMYYITYLRTYVENVGWFELVLAHGWDTRYSLVVLALRILKI